LQGLIKKVYKWHMKSSSRHSEYQYLDLMQEILEKGERKVDGRQTRYDLSAGFPLLTTKRVYWKGVLHELYWFMSGQTNIKYLVDNNVHIWDDYPYKMYKAKSDKGQGTSLTKEEFVEKIKDNASFAKKYGNLPRIYGEMWRHWPTRKKSRTIDQLAWVLKEMKDDPDAKNLIVNSWNPEYLYTMATHEDASRFPICHNMYQISNRDGKLSLQLYQRSADLFLGVPFNIASYSLLTIILAKIAGLEPGEFIHTFGDVHIYENHLEQVKEQLKRKPRPFPTVTIDKSVTSLDNFKPELVSLEGYDPYPMLKAELTVAGGLYDPQTGKMAA
jgi:thymidylate synthase